MMSFLAHFIISKAIFGGLSNVPPRSFLPCFPMTPRSKNMLKHEIFLDLMPITSPMYFLVSSNIISNTFNPQHLDVPYCTKSEISYANLCSWCFECPFLTSLLLFVVILLFLVDILIFLLFLTFHHPCCCLLTIYFYTQIITHNKMYHYWIIVIPHY